MRPGREVGVAAQHTLGEPPQWSPAVEAGKSLGLVRDSDLNAKPQWSPAVEAGKRFSKLGLPGLPSGAAMEPGR